MADEKKACERNDYDKSNKDRQSGHPKSVLRLQLLRNSESRQFFPR